MVIRVKGLSVTYGLNGKEENAKAKNGNGNVQFGFCPHCNKKGFYKVPQSYERCRFCGFYRMLLPGQDF